MNHSLHHAPRTCARLALATLGLGVALAATAHHSFAMFDMSRTVTLQGTVKELQFTNPHIWIQLVVRDPQSGQTTEYAIEGGSPTNLARSGWKRDVVKPGDPLSVAIHPLRSGKSGGSLVSFEFGQAVAGKSQ